MVGGNHSREAFQLLLKEPLLQLQESFPSRHATLNCNPTGEEALALGTQHNMNCETHLPSKFQDDVRLTRRLFADIEQPSEKKMLGFNDKMKAIFMKVFHIGVW